MRLTVLATALAFSTAALAMEPVTIIDQGVFAAGGTVIEAKSAYDPYHPKAEAQTPHGDHAIVSYQVPAQARALPLVFLHGASQISAAPDEGFFFEQFRMGLWRNLTPDRSFRRIPNLWINSFGR